MKITGLSLILMMSFHLSYAGEVLFYHAKCPPKKYANLPEKFKKLWDQGFKEIETGNWAKCIENFTKIIENDHNDSSALANRGYCVIRANNPSNLESGMKDTQKALELNPALVDVAVPTLVSGALAQVDDQKMSRAHYWLNVAIKANPKAPVAYSEQAYLYARANQPEKCIESANKAIKIDPAMASAFVNRGSCKLAINQNKSAIEDLQSAIKQKSEPNVRVSALVMLARTESLEHLCDSAKKHAQEALQLNGEVANLLSDVSVRCP